KKVFFDIEVIEVNESKPNELLKENSQSNNEPADETEQEISVASETQQADETNKENNDTFMIGLAIAVVVIGAIIYAVLKYYGFLDKIKFNIERGIIMENLISEKMKTKTMIKREKRIERIKNDIDELKHQLREQEEILKEEQTRVIERSVNTLNKTLSVDDSNLTLDEIIEFIDFVNNDKELT